jgi:hypothetical protein
MSRWESNGRIEPENTQQNRRATNNTHSNHGDPDLEGLLTSRDIQCLQLLSQSRSKLFIATITNPRLMESIEKLTKMKLIKVTRGEDEQEPKPVQDCVTDPLSPNYIHGSSRYSVQPEEKKPERKIDLKKDKASITSRAREFLDDR